MGRTKKKKKSGPKTVRPSTEAKLQKLAGETRELRERQNRARAELHRYRVEDIPAFDKCLDKHLAEERKEMTDLINEIHFSEDLLDEAQFAYMSGEFRSPADAIKTVKREMEKERAESDLEPDDNPEKDDPLPEMPDEIVDILFGTFMSEMRGIDVDDMPHDAYEKARADFASTFEHAKSGNKAAFEKALLRTGADDSADNRSAVKSAYRRLAKRLHPDHNGELGDAEKSLWEQASLYYQAVDLKGLQQVDVALTLERSEPIEPAQGPALRRYHDALAGEINHLEMEIRECKGRPAWGFSLKKLTPTLIKKVCQEFREALTEYREVLRELRESIAEAMAMTPQRRIPRKKKSPRKKATKKKASSIKKPSVPGKSAKAKPAPARQGEFDF